jgi:hypothetical protein
MEHPFHDKVFRFGTATLLGARDVNYATTFPTPFGTDHLTVCTSKFWIRLKIMAAMNNKVLPSESILIVLCFLFISLRPIHFSQTENGVRVIAAVMFPFVYGDGIKVRADFTLPPIQIC